MLINHQRLFAPGTIHSLKRLSRSMGCKCSVWSGWEVDRGGARSPLRKFASDTGVEHLISLLGTQVGKFHL